MKKRVRYTEFRNLLKNTPKTPTVISSRKEAEEAAEEVAAMMRRWQCSNVIMFDDIGMTLTEWFKRKDSSDIDELYRRMRFVSYVTGTQQKREYNLPCPNGHVNCIECLIGDMDIQCMAYRTGKPNRFVMINKKHLMLG